MEPKLPNRIRELRDTQRLSLRDLQERSGIAHTKLHRVESGTTPLIFDDAKRIAAALGVKVSALLNDDDVELRLDEEGQMLVEAIQEVPAPDRAAVVQMAAEIVRVARGMASSQRAGGALNGEEKQITHLAESWNAFDDSEREEALSLWRIAKLGRRTPKAA